MKSWVYIFSKFTNEALLLEGLGICILCAAYAAFWVLRKRRMGVIQTAVPSGVVKTYLNELIFDAEQLRAQLFGLLAASGIQISERTRYVHVEHAPLTESHQEKHATPVTTPASSVVVDPDLQKKIQALESKMAEQTKSMDSILNEKNRIEKELLEARKTSPTASADPESAQLKDKIQTLESRLAEYSVIEDDLANLKRLQQENAQLRETLAALGKPVSKAAPAVTKEASAPAPAPTPAAKETPPPSEPAAEQQISPEHSQEKVEPPVAEVNDPLDENSTTPATQPEISAPVQSIEDAFDQLVGQAEEAPPAESANAKNKTTSEAKTEEAAAPAASKLDEDLVAEFEKMLNS
jgi:predicted  nucleic acid-binding Zn-ribbon protein